MRSAVSVFAAPVFVPRHMWVNLLHTCLAAPYLKVSLRALTEKNTLSSKISVPLFKNLKPEAESRDGETQTQLEV